MQTLLAAVVLAIGGCVMPPLEPRVVLDEKTGVSLTIADAPIVLARNRRDVAVHARDYITLVAVEVNESGKRRLTWVAHQWSTIDARAADFQPTPGAELLMVADGRDLRLRPVSGPAADFARHRSLRRPEDARVFTTVYESDAATLEYVAASRTLSAAYPDSALLLPFTLWSDGRPALVRLLQRVESVE